MLFQDLLVAPAAGTVELGDHGFVVLDADLVNAVLVAVQRQQAAVRQQAHGFHGPDDGIRPEAIVGGAVFGGFLHGRMIPAKGWAWARRIT